MKQVLRAKFKQVREAIPTQFKAMADIAIKAKLDIVTNSYPAIAYYFAISDEVDITLPQKCILPAVIGDILEFHMCNIGDLIDGKFCKEPIPTDPIIPDVIILPCLSFDRKGHRLGYGKGLYDKTLSLDKYKNTLKIAVAYSTQQCSRVPHEPHDVTMDIIITEHEVIHILHQ